MPCVLEARLSSYYLRLFGSISTTPMPLPPMFFHLLPFPYPPSEDKCFVCSIDRFSFEQRLGGFADHVRHEHNPLHYLFYIDYLLKRNPTEYTGLESFVRSHLDAANYDWIPIGRALHIDRMQQAAATQHDSQQAVEGLRSTIDTMDVKLRQLEGAILGLRDDMHEGLLAMVGGAGRGRRKSKRSFQWRSSSRQPSLSRSSSSRRLGSFVGSRSRTLPAERLLQGRKSASNNNLW